MSKLCIFMMLQSCIYYSYVFNLDMPRCMEEYVHRVGRTGRAGKSGISITLICRRDWGCAAQLIEILTEANQVGHRAKVRLDTIKN